MRLKFVVAYDGTDFSGWARSPGNRTVHETLNDGIQRLINQDIDVTGASRTDAGAHARGQVCHFDTDVRIEPGAWPRALNRLLPPDLSILSSVKVGSEFHSRFCAEDRWYRYRIRMTERNPLESRFAHDHGRALDVAAMVEAARSLEGRNDYRAYTEELQPHIDNTVRTMRSVSVRQVRNEVWIEIGGTAFLRGMMRRMSGALLEVGSGKRSIESVGELLTVKRSEMQWPVVLPAKGLCLMRIRYGRPPKDCRTNSET